DRVAAGVVSPVEATKARVAVANAEVEREAARRAFAAARRPPPLTGTRTHSPSLARAGAPRRHGGAGRGELPAPADRRRTGHHQRAGPDQHRGAWLLAARGRAARHLPDRDRHRGASEARAPPPPSPLGP